MAPIEARLPRGEGTGWMGGKGESGGTGGQVGARRGGAMRCGAGMAREVAMGQGEQIDGRRRGAATRTFGENERKPRGGGGLGERAERSTD